MKKLKDNLNLISIIIYLLIYELIFIILQQGNLQNIGLKISFVVQISLIITILTSLWKEKTNKIIYNIIMIILPIICGIYYIYYKVFGTMLSITSLGKGIDVLQFSSTISSLIKENIIIVIILLVLLFAYLFFIRKKIEIKKISKHKIIVYIILFVVLYLSSIIVIHVNSKEDIYSDKNLYYKINNPTQNLERFGMFTTIRLDIQRKITNFKEKELYELKTEDGTKKILEKEKYNMVDIDFEELIQNETDETIIEIHKYLQSQEPTNKNKYTGLFEGKNLIFIVAESFSNIAINEELTPTLYKLANEGMQFENFYTPLFPVGTADGQYITDTSLLPKEGIWTIENVEGKLYPYSYANVLKNLGYTTYAYHNHEYDYYQRQKYFPTMNFDSYLANGNGLEQRMNFENYPSSDYEMVCATIEDYVNDEKFLAYYMTMSGHASYDKQKNSMVQKNWDLVKDLPYSENIKGYLATQIELDKAVEKIVSTLEAKDKLEDTVIIIVGDHYPYALTQEEITELSPYEITNYYFDKFHMPLIIYNGKNTENIIVEKYASSLDVLPTVLNLFGIEYDSRLLMGKDIFSDSDGLVIFSNRSFITNKGKYKFFIDKFYKNDENEEIEQEYIENIKEQIYYKFKYSVLIFEKDYYRKIFE